MSSVRFNKDLVLDLVHLTLDIHLTFCYNECMVEEASP